MPVHDWTRVDAGLFHAFHHRWIDALCDKLNDGCLPAEYFALPEQNVRGLIPDVLTLKLAPRDGQSGDGSGGIAFATVPPHTRLVRRSEEDIYAERANRLAVRPRHGDVVVVIEIISPGNKGSRAEFRSLVEKSAGLLRQKVHLMLIDLFPPGKRGPKGVHKAVWDEFLEVEFEVPPDKPLTLASYDAGPPRIAYIDSIGVGDVLPDMPLFLKPGINVQVPPEATYATTWSVFPAALKGLLDN